MQGSQQQQTVLTNAVIVSQPRQSAPVVSSFGNRQSTVIGILLIIFGALSILFNIVDIAVGTKSYYTYSQSYSYPYSYTSYSSSVYLSGTSLGVVGHGFWCGAMVSGVDMVSLLPG